LEFRFNEMVLLCNHQYHFEVKDMTKVTIETLDMTKRDHMHVFEKMVTYQNVNVDLKMHPWINPDSNDLEA